MNLATQDIVEFLNAIPGCEVEQTEDGFLVKSMLSREGGEKLASELARTLRHEDLDPEDRKRLEGLRQHLKVYLFTWRFGTSPPSRSWRDMDRDERTRFIRADPEERRRMRADPNVGVDG